MKSALFLKRKVSASYLPNSAARRASAWRNGNWSWCNKAELRYLQPKLFDNALAVDRYACATSKFAIVWRAQIWKHAVNIHFLCAQTSSRTMSIRQKTTSTKTKKQSRNKVVGVVGGISMFYSTCGDENFFYRPIFLQLRFCYRPIYFKHIPTHTNRGVVR